MAQVSVGLRLDEDLLARIDKARGDVPRARWIARALEAALVVEKSRQGALAASQAIVANPAPYSRAVVEAAQQALGEQAARTPLSGHSRPAVRQPPAPAEQPQTPDYIAEGGMVGPEAYRSSSFAKRDVRPVPKKGG